MGSAVAEAEDGEGVGEHFATGVEISFGVVGERGVEEVLAVVLASRSSSSSAGSTRRDDAMRCTLVSGAGS